MAFEGYQLRPPALIAGADLSASSAAFKFVKLNADNQVILCSANTDVPIGVLQMPAPTSATGQPVVVCSFGVTKVQAAGSLTAGMAIGTSSGAQAENHVAGTDTTKYVVGQVLEVTGGTTAGNFITALINCHGPRRAA